MLSLERTVKRQDVCLCLTVDQATLLAGDTTEELFEQKSGLRIVSQLAASPGGSSSLTKQTLSTLRRPRLDHLKL
ncbi:hypothetical protein CHARACLAT_010653 [Characodon lateralis]|uniref:Uncharacterized protein n=1 Tax=Characodon lateralis TaxID=208331 RepID=A0ABU7ESS7_9TELE|nr:hypothetical protein [Characodon lateralis]